MVGSVWRGGEFRHALVVGAVVVRVVPDATLTVDSGVNLGEDVVTAGGGNRGDSHATRHTKGNRRGGAGRIKGGVLSSERIEALERAASDSECEHQGVVFCLPLWCVLSGRVRSCEVALRFRMEGKSGASSVPNRTCYHVTVDDVR